MQKYAQLSYVELLKKKKKNNLQLMVIAGNEIDKFMKVNIIQIR